MHRNALSKGNVLLLKNTETGELTSLEITSEPLGRGSSSIVYEAQTSAGSYSCKYRLKELYPTYIDGIQRDNQNQLLITEDAAADYEAAKVKFNKALDMLWEFAYSDLTGSYTVTPLGRFEGVTDQNCKALYLITQWMPSDYIDTSNLCRSSDIQLAAKICRKTADAAAAFHKLGYINLDIKPENILYSAKTDTIAFFDTDTIFKMDEPPANSISYSDGAAPEIRNSFVTLYSEKVDVFSIGSMLHRFITGENYFAGQYSLKLSSKNNDLSQYPMCRQDNPRTAAMIKNVLGSCNAGSPTKRCSTDELSQMLRQIEDFTTPGSIFAKNSYIPFSEESEVYSDEANILRRMVNRESYAVIQGLHNSGKSKFAAYYANRFKAHYHTIIWANFNGSIKNTVASIPFSGINDDEYDSSRLFEIKYDSLKKYDNETLLIIDGMDSSDDFLEEFLETLNIHIIITSALIVDLKRSHIFKMKAEQELLFSDAEIENFHRKISKMMVTDHFFICLYSALLLIFTLILCVLAFVIRDFSVIGTISMSSCILFMLMFRSMMYKRLERYTISKIRCKNCRKHFKSAFDFANAVNNHQIFEINAPDFISDTEKKRHRFRLIIGSASIALGIVSGILSVWLNSFPLLVALSSIILTFTFAIDYLYSISITNEMYNRNFGSTDIRWKRDIKEIYGYKSKTDSEGSSDISSECKRQILYQEYKTRNLFWGVIDVAAKTFTVLSILTLVTNLLELPSFSYFRVSENAPNNIFQYICIFALCALSSAAAINSKDFYLVTKDILFTIYTNDSRYMNRKFSEYSEEGILSQLSSARGIYGYTVSLLEKEVPIYEIDKAERPTFKHYCITQNSRTLTYFLLLTLAAVSLTVWHTGNMKMLLPTLISSAVFQLWWFFSGSMIHNRRLLKLDKNDSDK